MEPMAIDIPGYEDAKQAAQRLKVTVQHVYNLNSSRDDFPAPVYVGRTPLWPVDRLDAWREDHPKRGD
ncbi:hypothetical protein Saa2_01468 [Streptomyces acidiscabies]|nr:hypothetical protein Saa2_01468 [Streptomyces acidiscabies]